MNNYTAAYQTYQSIELHSEIEGASDHDLIDLLYKGIQDKLAKARGYIEQKNTIGKGEEIGKIIAILTELQSSLDFERGGDIATNLYTLYTYMLELVVTVNTNDDLDSLEQASQLVSHMRESWNMIPRDQRS